MKEREQILSRRRMLRLMGGFGSLALTGSAVLAQEAVKAVTPFMDLGPFYPVLKPLDQDADLTVLGRRTARAEGKIVHITGRVMDAKGKPVSGARIEIWQANTHGRYSHPSDPNTAAPLDPNFQGYGVIKTDSEGRYRFKTIKPGAYPISPTQLRTPHIHVDVMGITNRLGTQMFFPDEPLNAKDFVLQNTPFDKSGVIAKALPQTKEIAPDELLLGWDIVLVNG